MNKETFTDSFLDFLENSPTSFHAAKNLVDIFTEEGFELLDEKNRWEIQYPGKYVVTRNGSALIAFRTGKDCADVSGIKMTGAHTDSPGLKIKPVPEINSAGYIGLDVEIYGGVLLNTWFDRDLSIAGRVTGINEKGMLLSCLVDFKKPVAFIPSLAIHLNREANTSKTVNPQKEMLPVIMRCDTKISEQNFSSILLEEAKKNQPDIFQIFAHELYLYDTQPPSLTGLKKEFITGARLDNLASCYAAAMALKDSSPGLFSLIVLNDSEEVGSSSISGADGCFLKSTLERLCGTGDSFARTMAKSMFVSADNAHGIHPNYTEKHDSNHRPVMNMGPAVKTNASQRYATDSETSAIIKIMAARNEIPVQNFVMKSDMACGSTIGPLTASLLGVKTADIGIPTLGMHSIREIAGKDDIYMLYCLVKFFNQTTG